MTTANTTTQKPAARKGPRARTAPARTGRTSGAGPSALRSAEVNIPSDGPLDPPVYGGIIGSYNPRKSKFPMCTQAEWEAVAPAVRLAVSNLDGMADRGLRPYLTAMVRLSVWAHREGLPLEPTALLSHRVIEAHSATLDANAGTFRSQLRRLAAANGVAVEETSTRYKRPSYSTPYTVEEVHTLLTFAGSLSNEHRRRQLTGCILLGAGCGFSRGDLRGVCNNDVHRHDGVRYVRTHDRCTPILAGFEAEFDAYLEWCGDGPFVGVRPGANITDRMAAWVGERAGVPRFSTDRLRTFFVVEHLRRGTPVLTLLAIAGFSRVDALEPYLAFVPAPHTPCGPGQAGAR